MSKNMTDITDMTDAALDVFMRVKGGEDCVVVDHLSPGERHAVCEALGVKPPLGWLHNSPSADRVPRARHCDYEGLILAEQDEHFPE